MKSPEYFDLKQFIEQESTCAYIPLDSILSKLDNQDLRDLKEIIKEFYESGKEDGKTSYYDGYDNGYEDAEEFYIDEDN